MRSFSSSVSSSGAPSGDTSNWGRGFMVINTKLTAWGSAYTIVEDWVLPWACRLRVYIGPTCRLLNETSYSSPVFGMLFIIKYQVMLACMPELYGLRNCNYGHSLSMPELGFAGHDKSGCRSFANRSIASRQIDDLNDLVYATEIVGHLTISVFSHPKCHKTNRLSDVAVSSRDRFHVAYLVAKKPSIALWCLP